jgi:hypothetical protein
MCGWKNGWLKYKSTFQSSNLPLLHQPSLFIQQLFPNHRCAAFGAFDGGTFYPCLVRYFFTTFSANAIAANAHGATFVPATSSTESKAFSVSK